MSCKLWKNAGGKTSASAWSTSGNPDATLSLSPCDTGCTLTGVAGSRRWTLPFADDFDVQRLTAALLLLELGWAPDVVGDRLPALGRWACA